MVKAEGKSNKINFIRSIKGKLILFFVLVGALPALIVGIISYTSASTAITDGEYAKLTAIRDIKKSQIETYFGERMADVSVLASNAEVITGVANIEAAFMEEGGTGGPLWNEEVAEHGVWLTQYEQEYGY
ncbi:MAG: hypothetical protein V3R87_10815, partial [Dehalococcoidia bacterium]